MNYLVTLTDKDIFPHKEIIEITTWSPRKTVKILLINEEGMIALVTNPIHNCFLLPGGGIDEGEDIFVAANRECCEEVGFLIVSVENIGVVEEFRARDQKHYETFGVMAKVGEKIVEDLRTEGEKQNGLAVVWCTADEVEKKFVEQEVLVCEGKIDFYNTAFNIVRDFLFFKEARKRNILF